MGKLLGIFDYLGSLYILGSPRRPAVQYISQSPSNIISLPPGEDARNFGSLLQSLNLGRLYQGVKSIWAGKSIHSNTDTCIDTPCTVSAFSGSKVMSLDTYGDNQRHPRCAIMIGIWMSGTEIEVHFNFGRYDCDWTQFKLLLKCIIDLVQQLLQGRKRGQITDLISLVL